MEKLVAYKRVDPEGDHWAEDIFIFQSQEDVNLFFHPGNQELIDLFTEEGEIEDGILEDFEITFTPSGKIVQIKFNTIYAGDVKIVEVSGGYLIPTPYAKT